MNKKLLLKKIKRVQKALKAKDPVVCQKMVAETRRLLTLNAQ